MLASGVCAADAAPGRVLDAGPADYTAQVPQLRPGDRLRLAPGEYRHGLTLHGVEGTAQAPIVIQGAPDGSTVFVAQRGRNTASLANVAHLVLRNLSFDGRHLDADAVKCEGHARYAHHVVLDKLRIRDHDGSQGTVGISTKCPAWNWTVKDNVIVRTGTGMYLGNSDGTAPFVAGTIIGNRIAQTVGYNLQIKHQLPRPPVEGMPQTPQTTLIAHNQFSKGAGSSTGSMARPNVLLGGWPAHGPGRDDRYLVRNNLFDGNPTEAVFQAEGRVEFRNNRAFNPHGDGLVFQPHRGPVETLAIEGNTVAAFGYALFVSSEVAPIRIRASGNLIHGVVSFDGLDATLNAVRPYDPAAVERLRNPDETDDSMGRNRSD